MFVATIHRRGEKTSPPRAVVTDILTNSQLRQKPVGGVRGHSLSQLPCSYQGTKIAKTAVCDESIDFASCRNSIGLQLSCKT